MPDTLYEYYDGATDSSSGVTGSIWFAQTFTIGTVGTNVNHTITSVSLSLLRYGSPGTLRVGIYATDGNGKPTGEELAYGTTNGNTLPTALAEERNILISSYELLASTKYAIVCSAADADMLNIVYWRADGSSPTYTGGSYAVSLNGGSSWTVYTSTDHFFKEYGISIVNITFNTMVGSGISWKWDIAIVDTSISPRSKTQGGIGWIWDTVSDTDTNYIPSGSATSWDWCVENAGQ
jgi:hypothetical protein